MTKRGDELITKSDIESAVGVKMAVSEEMRVAMEQWYKLFLGICNKEQKEGLHLANSICTEFTRLIFAESEIKVNGQSERAKFMQSTLDTILPLLQTKIGIGLALGGMVFKPYFSNGEITIDMVRADCMFPVSFCANGAIREAVFLEPYTDQSDSYYTRIEYHIYEPDKRRCVISNYTFHSHNADTLGVSCEISETPWSGLGPVTIIENVNQSMFGYFKVPKSNNVDPDSPLGISVYAGCLSQIIQADKQWSSILWEYEAKEAAVFATMDLFNPNEKLSKHDERLFKKVCAADKAEGLLKEYSPEIRDKSLFDGLNNILQRIEFNCGFAYGTISSEPTAKAEKTATEIIISRQRSYTFVSALQKQMETALEQMLYAVDNLITFHNLLPNGDYELSCNWGDSVIEDTKETTQTELQMVRDGILKPEIALSHYYRCSEEEAKKMMPNKLDNMDYSMYGGDI